MKNKNLELVANKLVKAFLKNKIISPIPSRYTKKIAQAQKFRKLCESKIKKPIIGKENLIKRKENPQKKLVGLELIGKEKAVNADCVHVGRSQVGTITSGVISPVLNKNIALCRMDVKYCEIGTEVEVGKIDGHQKRIRAKVVRFPFYDPDKTRVRA